MRFVGATGCLAIAFDCFDQYLNRAEDIQFLGNYDWLWMILTALWLFGFFQFLLKEDLND